MEPSTFAANVFLGQMSLEDARRGILRAVRRLAERHSLVETDPQEADRKIRVVRFGQEPWLAIFDDLMVTEGHVVARELHRVLGCPLIATRVDGSELAEVVLFVDGAVVANLHTPELSRTSRQRRITSDSPLLRFRQSPYFEPWQAVMPPGITPQQLLEAWTRSLPKSERMREVLLLLGFDPGRWNVTPAALDAVGTGWIDCVCLGFRLSPQLRGVLRTSRTVAPSGPGQLLIPDWLCAPARQVKVAWRKRAAQLFRRGSWEEALEGTTYIPLEQAPRMLVLSGPPMEGADDEDNVMLYPIPEILRLATDADGDRIRAVQLVLDGVGQFWFALAALTSPDLLPEEVVRPIRAPFMRAFLERMMPWWPQFCALSDRFHAGTDWLPLEWPRWADSISAACARAGMPQALRAAVVHCEDAVTAGEMINQWLESGAA